MGDVLSDKKFKYLDLIAKELCDPIYIINKEGYFLEVIGGTEKSLYFSGSVLKGQMLKDFIGNKSVVELILSSIREAIKKKKFIKIEYQVKENEILLRRKERPQGSHWFEGRISVLPVLIDGEPVVAWYSVNITERKKLEIELKRMSETDPLTGASNRRFFIDQIDQWFKMYQRYKTKNCIIMFDIDYFKRVNDNYGHLIGDEVLKSFVRICKNNFRETDVFARYGGDEFTALLPNTPHSKAFQIAERIRKAVEKSGFIVDEKNVFYTVSAGLTRFQSNDNTYNDALNRADIALYEAKRSGRNQTLKK